MQPADSGPIYAETLHSTGWPVEPWNTVSNLIFLAIIGYWCWKMRKTNARHPFILGCLPILLVGYIGGTMYHGTRSADLWYKLDYMPIMALVLATALYLWRKTTSWVITAVVVVSIEAVGTFMRESSAWQQTTRISMGYAWMSLQIFLPLFLFAKARSFKHAGWLGGAIAAIVGAILLRQLDRSLSEWLPQGTHFLWHILGGVSVQCLVMFIYKSDFESESFHRTASKTKKDGAAA